MCETCGCGSDHKEFTLHTVLEENPENHDHYHHDEHMHEHDNEHHHDHPHEHKHVIAVETDILAKNNLLAERNRGFFEAKQIKAINLVSSPGSGKTTLLEKLVITLKGKKNIYVIEGDQQTTNDARRIEATGVKAIQINTGNGCHLDAHMITRCKK